MDFFLNHLQNHKILQFWICGYPEQQPFLVTSKSEIKCTDRPLENPIQCTLNDPLCIMFIKLRVHFWD